MKSVNDQSASTPFAVVWLKRKPKWLYGLYRCKLNMPPKNVNALVDKVKT